MSRIRKRLKKEYLFISLFILNKNMGIEKVGNPLWKVSI